MVMTAEAIGAGPEMAPSSVAKMLERTTGLRLAIWSPGNSRKASLAVVEVEANKEWLSLTKKLIKAPEFDAILSFDRQTTKTVSTVYSVPSPFGRGIYFVVKERVLPCQQYIDGRREPRQALINAYLDVYEEAINAAERALGTQFNRGDYLSREELAGQFGMTTQWLTFGTPTDLPAEIREQERETAQRIYQDAAAEVQQLARAAFARHVQWIADKMSGKLDGKKKQISPEMWTRIQEFLRDFDLTNVTDDAELKVLVDRARTLLKGVDVKTVKDSATLQTRLNAGFAAIQKQMAPMMVERPSRRLYLDEG